MCSHPTAALRTISGMETRASKHVPVLIMAAGLAVVMLEGRTRQGEVKG